MIARRFSSIVILLALILVPFFGCTYKTIHEAVIAGDLAGVRRHLQEGVEVNAIDEQGRTPLFLAAKQGNTDMVLELLSHNADPNLLDKEQSSPLHKAVRANSPEVAQILLTYGANPNAKDKNGDTPLHLASNAWGPRLIELLVKNGAEVNAKNIDGATPLDIALTSVLGEAAYLLEHGIEWTIHAAAALGEIEKLRDFLSSRASPDSRNYKSYTPLHYAIIGNQLKAAMLLFEHGANPNVQDEAGHTPLHLAAMFGRLEGTRLLLAHGADPNVTDEEGKTPLGIVRNSLRAIKSLAGLPQRKILGTEGIRRYEAIEKLLYQYTTR